MSVPNRKPEAKQAVTPPHVGSETSSPDYGPRSTGWATRWLACLSLCLSLSSCAWLPHEFNLSPFYRQRLAEDGTVLELDVLWPIVHYETTPAGGTDFRVRPFYRRVTEPAADPDAVLTPSDGFPSSGVAATEHQFAWPLGRVRTDAEETHSRFFPLWWHRARSNDLGLRETDWYLLFPFFWGGSREDGQENYFGMFPLYADFPDFLTYERFRVIAWPLYTGLEKQGWATHIFAWPFIAYASHPERGFSHRVLPFYSYRSTDTDYRVSLAYPFIHWGEENLHTDNPVAHAWLWPLIGHRWNTGGPASTPVSSWSFLWPFFQYVSIGDRLTKVDAFWPIFRYHHDRSESTPLWQWWVWPLIGRTITDDQWAWNLLWPLIWLRTYEDPGFGTQTQSWFLPVYWSVDRERPDETRDKYDQIWPFWHRSSDLDGASGDWNVLSPWPYRAGNAYGFAEAYDWFWTLLEGRQRSPEDHSVEAWANVYTSRTRGSKTQTSVPFLFNYESDEEGGVLRLFQFIPISFGSDASTGQSAQADQPDQANPSSSEALPR